MAVAAASITPTPIVGQLEAKGKDVGCRENSKENSKERTKHQGVRVEVSIYNADGAALLFGQGIGLVPVPRESEIELSEQQA